MIAPQSKATPSRWRKSAWLLAVILSGGATWFVWKPANPTVSFVRFEPIYLLPEDFKENDLPLPQNPEFSAKNVAVFEIRNSTRHTFHYNIADDYVLAASGQSYWPRKVWIHASSCGPRPILDIAPGAIREFQVEIPGLGESAIRIGIPFTRGSFEDSREEKSAVNQALRRLSWKLDPERWVAWSDAANLDLEDQFRNFRPGVYIRNVVQWYEWPSLQSPKDRSGGLAIAEEPL